MKRCVALLLALAACGRTPRPKPAMPAPPRVGPGGLADASIDSPIDATTEVATPGDPPEPTEPQAECRFDRKVSCRPSLPVLSAVGPPPFEGCPLTPPAPRTAPVGPDSKPQLSAIETRKMRRTKPDACCYVEFVATLCL